MKKYQQYFDTVRAEISDCPGLTTQELVNKTGINHAGVHFALTQLRNTNRVYRKKLKTKGRQRPPFAYYPSAS